MRSTLLALLAFLSCQQAPAVAVAENNLAAPDPATLAEIAPTGTLRVGLFGSATFESGFGRDLATYLGAKIGVPVDVKFFVRDLKGFFDCALSGACDVIAAGITPDRAKMLQFTPPFMELEMTYLVRGDSLYRRIEDLDQTGIAISVLPGSVVDRELTATLHHASLRESALAEAERTGQLADGKIDAIAENADQLARWSRMVPGSRLIPGHFGIVRYGLATGMGKAAASRFLDAIVRFSLDSGDMARMISARGLHGHVPQN